MTEMTCTSVVSWPSRSHFAIALGAANCDSVVYFFRNNGLVVENSEKRHVWLGLEGIVATADTIGVARVYSSALEGVFA